MKGLRSNSLLATMILLLPTIASAQTTSSAPTMGSGRVVVVDTSRHPWDYGGISPGNNGIPPGFRRRIRTGGRPIVAWPGFQVTPDGSRLFLAVTAMPTVTEERTTAGRFVYRLHNASVVVHNNTRALETGAFATPVQRAYLRRRGRDVDLIIEMRAAAAPRLTRTTNAAGLQFIFVEFATWRAPESTSRLQDQAVRPSPEAPPSAPSTLPSSPVLGTQPGAPRVLDDERPPTPTP